MTDLTPNLSLPYIMAARAQKHVTHNEAVRILDALVQLAVADRDLATPPAAPADGARYIVAASPSGAWAILAPKEGWLAWVADENLLLAYDGAAWAGIGGGGAGSVNPTPLVGVNATADTTNRLSVNSPATLLNHEGAGHQLKINKAAVANTASLLFQDAFSGRAEIGLAGDDDLHMKVSADGSTWRDAIVVSRSTGVVSMPFTSLGGGSGGGSNSFADGRLTLAAGTPVMTASVTGATTLRYTPAVGNKIGLYDGTAWAVTEFAETTISLAGQPADTNLDVFGYLTSGALELLAWANSALGSQARATALVRQDGVLVKTGAPTRRYLGTIRTTAAGQCSWIVGGDRTDAKAHVFNADNRRRFSFKIWSEQVQFRAENLKAAAIVRMFDNGQSACRVSYVDGLGDDAISADILGLTHSTQGNNCGFGIGFDTTTAYTGISTWALAGAQPAAYGGGNLSTPSRSVQQERQAGYHFFQALEHATGSGNVGWYFNYPASITTIPLRAAMYVEGWF